MQQLLNLIASHFQIKPSDIEVTKILHGNREKQNVCRLKIRLKHYLLKRYEITDPVSNSGYTPIQVERFTLSTLYKSGCLVPRVIWHSDRQHALLLEWRGDQTLDSLAQNNPVETIMPELEVTLRILCKIESAFAENRNLFKPYVFHFDAKESLQSLLEQGRDTIGYLQELRKTSIKPSEVLSLDEAWDSLANRLLEAPLTLDSLDYQARNILFDGELPYFIDFASVGWDWQERRLVQYFNSLGASPEGANFVSLLDRELVHTYAEWVVQHRENSSVEDVAARVDGHHLLFYLTVIHKILDATVSPRIRQNQVLVQAWGDLRLRYHQALSLIINTNLSDDVYIQQIRKMIGEFQDGI